MVKDAFPIALAIAGILSLLVGFRGIQISAAMIGCVIESRIMFWNVILFATLIAAGGIALGYAVGKKYA